MSGLSEHPGYLGFTSQGVIAIHADWPVYPEEHGADLALLWLTAFPPGAVFKRPSGIDGDIDRCVLLLADVKCSNRKNPFDERNFHVAIWHEDLLELRENSFITGVTAITERRWEELRRAHINESIKQEALEELERSDVPVEQKRARREELEHTNFLDLLHYNRNGTWVKAEFPSLDDYDSEEGFRPRLAWPEFVGEGVIVTDSGRDRIASLLTEASAKSDIQILGERIQKLLELAFFDTSVREACLALEHRVKTWLSSDRWGDVLVNDFITRLRDDGKFRESSLRILRGQMRTAFKFIRNDYMHNFVNIDETQCRSLLFRIARIKAELETVLSCA